ncbi:MAG TPA: hypothetical protein VN829_00015 [Dongiaceae bacterium]|nr:hypothetical protein [Dongiaceae bacterium]
MKRWAILECPFGTKTADRGEGIDCRGDEQRKALLLEKPSELLGEPLFFGQIDKDVSV